MFDEEVRKLIEKYFSDNHTLLCTNIFNRLDQIHKRLRIQKLSMGVMVSGNNAEFTLKNREEHIEAVLFRKLNDKYMMDLLTLDVNVNILEITDFHIIYRVGVYMEVNNDN